MHMCQSLLDNDLASIFYISPWSCISSTMLRTLASTLSSCRSGFTAGCNLSACIIYPAAASGAPQLAKDSGAARSGITPLIFLSIMKSCNLKTGHQDVGSLIIMSIDVVIAWRHD